MVCLEPSHPSPREQTLRERRQSERSRLYREQRGLQLLRSALVGLAAGALAVLYQLAVQQASRLSVGAGAAAQSWSVGAKLIFIAITATIGAVASWLIGRYAPESGGSGIPHIKASLLHLKQIRPLRIIFAKFFGGLAALLAGMSFGREGPTVQMGACVGKYIGEVLKVPRRSRDSLIASGAGAGLAAAFNAPLAGFLFVMEELKREMSAITYGSALVASVCAVAVTRYTLGQQSSFRLTSPGSAPLSILPLVGLLGLIAGGAGVLFNKTLMGGLDLRGALKLKRWQMGALAGVVSGAALIWFPDITGGGHTLAESILSGQFKAPNVLLAVGFIFVGKLLLTSGSYATGLPGGIFAPILSLGAVLGYGYGVIVHRLMPGTPFSAEGFATLGMASLLAASVRAPLTGVVLIVEMTAEYSLLYALLVAAFAADLAAQALKDNPIYEALMERDLSVNGMEIHPDEEPILLEVLIEPDSEMDGKRVSNLQLPPGAILATIERGARHMVPGGATVLRSGDMITLMIEGDKPELSLRIHEASKSPS